ncbi:hypothetical protein [Arsukibacterium sp. MJ3]|uniref:hypothetical protein n=1 Tax=Arsukibacterium sp. MJ3 TaxID=1632859 RepID=UPI0013792AB2|nr:hypothetical protein [Arsukibacterium sp. MJ3]
MAETMIYLGIQCFVPSVNVDPIWSTAPSVFCAVSRANPIMAKTLLTGLKTLVDNQFIDQQLHRYKGIAKEELQ